MAKPQRDGATETRVEQGRLRIIGGEYRHRIIRTLCDRRVRPMPDRTRAALFSALEARGWLLGAQVWDAFAGSGVLGLECLSRGAAQATFCEQDPDVVAALQDNLHGLKIPATVARIIHGDVWAVLMACSTHHLVWRLPLTQHPRLVLLDPPYALLAGAEFERGWASLAELVVALCGPSTEGILPLRAVLGHENTVPLRETLGGLRLTWSRTYGRTCLAFFEPDMSATTPRTTAR